MTTTIQDVQGSGTVHCCRVNCKVTLSTLTYTYPLRLVSPRAHTPNHVSVYVLTYGGGLVSGDRISLTVKVDEDCAMSLLTQSSTKVFRQRPTASSLDEIVTQISPPTNVVQTLSARISRNALLAVLPEPVTCFADASYNQRQVFRLEQGASLVLLDWFTSGRKSRGEAWQFDRYASVNEIWVEGDAAQSSAKLILRDAWLLDDEKDSACNPKTGDQHTYKERVEPYHCFANLILAGHRVSNLVAAAMNAFDKVLITASGSGGCAVSSSIQSLIWSASPLPLAVGDITGIVIRAAAMDTPIMRTFLNEMLVGLDAELGENLFSLI
ncbi:uncharacterized protein SPPG_00321 [Spizellomyces punctatus DAOM BR117]|uniref:Urease accessory protein UreD n=1 Tax=Spizellomyces punctatus (strain DAOM BR117) TaxID=645134 RepID=A0A0L0HU32_SPIPD|nr:uncharacterized protein SPPG_00321 [Spizellomyces punctatus DAOM BR117]KND04603.1 hypothetical protein SPPG_00321 [Spizellomyces punctatus DAOM BR117]|eukprot:XP_016612642.1 hypothetical protein SPPG_00321 [Spizellomyces punctatus DAOM BR117]